MNKPTPTLDKLKYLTNVLKDLIVSKFFGEISIKFQDGNIVHCRMVKDIKLE